MTRVVGAFAMALFVLLVVVVPMSAQVASVSSERQVTISNLGPAKAEVWASASMGGRALKANEITPWPFYISVKLTFPAKVSATTKLSVCIKTSCRDDQSTIADTDTFVRTWEAAGAERFPMGVYPIRVLVNGTEVGAIKVTF